MTVAPRSSELAELAELDQRFSHASPLEIVEWALSTYDDAAVACSFEDLVLVDLVHRVRPETPIIFLDTQAHFAQTLEFVERTSQRLGLNLIVTTPGPEAAATPCGSEGCCELRKVEPLERALRGRQAWLTALKRVDSPLRADIPVVGWDTRFDLIKINPLATWTDDDIEYYLNENGLEEHPLWSEGYASIGCEPTTMRPAPGADRRSGRWQGSDKSECGLHLA